MTDVVRQTLTMPVQQDPQPPLTLSNGHERCCGRTASGHQCSRSAAPGNEGFCRIHRRSENSRLHPAQVEARRQEALSRNITVRQVNYEIGWRRHIMLMQQPTPEDEERARRNQENERQLQDIIRRDREQILQRNRIIQELEQKAYEAEQANLAKLLEKYTNLWKKLEEQGEDPVQGLLNKGERGRIVLVSRFHDQYVEWKKRQPDYEPEQCAICIEPCDDCPEYQSCGHAFHHACIARWKRRQDKASCPCCRSRMITITHNHM